MVVYLDAQIEFILGEERILQGLFGSDDDGIVAIYEGNAAMDFFIEAAPALGVGIQSNPDLMFTLEGNALSVLNEAFLNKGIW